MKIYIYRHGETNWNIEGKIKGQIAGLKTSFTKEGNKQIEHLIEIIKEDSCEAIFTSDMVRTYETAKIISKRLMIPLYPTSAFRGLDVGNLQGVSKEEFNASDAAQRAFVDYDFPFPDGESINQLLERLFQGLNTIRDSYRYENVVVITHGTVISNLKARILNEKFIPIDYCTIETDEKRWKLLDFGLYKSFLG